MDRKKNRYIKQDEYYRARLCLLSSYYSFRLKGTELTQHVSLEEILAMVAKGITAACS